MTSPPDVLGLVAELLASDPDVMERDELGRYLDSIAALHAWADARKVRATRRLRALAEAGRSEAPRDALTKHGRQTGKEAHAADLREKVCHDLPNFEDALAAGAVSAGHVDAIAAATKNLDEAALNEFHTHAEHLLADAENTSVDAFGRNCRDLARFINAQHQPGSAEAEFERQVRDSKVKRWTDKDTGQKMTLLAMDPVRDAKWWAGVTRTRKQLSRQPGGDKRPFDQLLVDAVVEAAQGNSDGTSGAVAQVHVLIDLDTLLGELHERGICELDDGTPLPAAIVRQLACEAEIIPIVLNGRGQVLDVGAKVRLATEAQRQALRAMYRTCGDPDCDCPGQDAEAHHVTPYSEGGATDLGNLIRLCKLKGCHTKYHEGGWTMEIDPDRNITITRPDGAVHFKGSTIDRAPTGLARR